MGPANAVVPNRSAATAASVVVFTFNLRGELRNGGPAVIIFEVRSFLKAQSRYLTWGRFKLFQTCGAAASGSSRAGGPVLEILPLLVRWRKVGQADSLPKPGRRPGLLLSQPVKPSRAPQTAYDNCA